MTEKVGVELEEAIRLVCEHTKVIKETKLVSLLELDGRCLAEDIVAPMNQPPFDRSPIDGYACKSKDLMGASRQSPVSLQVLEEIDAGMHTNVTVGDGQCVRIMTGAMIPMGCDCCVRQESTDYGETIVQIYEPVKAYGNYCFAGEDIKEGSLVCKKGEILDWVSIGILASLGISQARVYRRPNVALLITGDEIFPFMRNLPSGKIYDSNRYLLVARMKQFDIDGVGCAYLWDDEDEIAEKLMQWSQWADVIITTGGVSVGKKDVFHQALPLAGAERMFWKIKMKPGTPVIASILNGVPILSLSGNPFAALTSFELLLRPMFAKMMQDNHILWERQTAVLQNDFDKESSVRRLVRAIYENGMVQVPTGLHSSGVLGSMKGCNCLIDIPAGSQALQAGQRVNIIII